MGSLFRSQEMTLCQLFLQSEAAYACVSELGELGLVQFRDLNPDVNAFQRKFVNEIRRCDEMERILRFLDKEVRKDGIPIFESGENPEAPQPREMIDLEATFEKLENEMKEINANSEALKRNYLELSELKHILRKTQNFFDERESEVMSSSSEATSALNSDKGLFITDGQGPSSMASNLGFVAGVILRERIPAFERMLWRVCRGNVFLRHTEIEAPMEDPHTGNDVFKSVFIIFFQGDQLKSRVKKICEAFRATLYPCPETPAERREMAFGVMTRIEDLSTVLGQTTDHRHRVLVAAAKNINMWFTKVHKIKAIYHTLNLFNLDVTQKCLIGECWCPVIDLDRIRLALRRGTELSGASVPSILNRMDTSEVPPTYHKTNKFTSGYQAIVDAYGIANYREVNPAPFTVITFPFLFAVMFGDFGHGIVMAMLAFFLVWKENWIMNRRISGEIFGTIFGGRYIIFMMGLFSIYTGFIYNDVFGKSVNIFGSRWRVNRTIYHYDESRIPTENDNYQLDPVLDFRNASGPYPFGLDPVWALSGNKISFINSFKMKMSVILGVMQMLFGIVLSCFNHVFFGRMINVFCEFIPQVLFLLCLFGYLCCLIFYKWVNFTAYEAGCAPSLLIGLINMFLLKYQENPTNADGTECMKNTFYSAQKSFQTFLVLLALICVPWMLVIKPVVLYRRWKASRNAMPLTNSTEDGDAHNHVETKADHGGGGHDDHGASGATFDTGNIVIYQAIHTIEFCLGIISNTASYLRLWALSLAHSQLSEVLWTMVMKFSFSIDGWGGIPLLFFLFAAWAGLTLAILVMMEGMSAFLHALRLHWVEFQNKFYGGQGYPFTPFSFATILEGNKPADE